MQLFLYGSCPCLTCFNCITVLQLRMVQIYDIISNAKVKRGPKKQHQQHLGLVTCSSISCRHYAVVWYLWVFINTTELGVSMNNKFVILASIVGVLEWFWRQTCRFCLSISCWWQLVFMTHYRSEQKCFDQYQLFAIKTLGAKRDFHTVPCVLIQIVFFNGVDYSKVILIWQLCSSQSWLQTTKMVSSQPNVYEIFPALRI